MNHLKLEVSEETIARAEELAGQFSAMKTRVEAFRDAGGEFPQHISDSLLFFKAGPMYGLMKNDMDLEAATKEMIHHLELLIGFASTLPKGERVGETNASEMVANDFRQREEQQYQH